MGDTGVPRGRLSQEDRIMATVLLLIGGLVLVIIVASRPRDHHPPRAPFEIARFQAALACYIQETGKVPGADYPAGENAFPALFEALYGERPPEGGGGPNAPYAKFKEADVLVFDAVQKDWRPADDDEVYDPRVKKSLSDPWGRPYIYRVVAGSPLDSKASRVIYSVGRDGIDSTAKGERGDDITTP